MADAALALSQKAELTFKHNTKLGRHGWLRLTPAYSVKIVDEILDRHDDHSPVLEPFSGTGTTALCAAYHGHKAIAVDVNPFLVWFGQAKVAHYDSRALADARKAAHEVTAAAESHGERSVPPPIFNIERWWDAPALRQLCALKAAIDRASPPDSPERDLLSIAFCRTMISSSNAAFNHQSMSFKKADQAVRQRSLFSRETDPVHRFHADVQFVLDSAAMNPAASASVLAGDSRHLGRVIKGEKAGLVITSPPYPNRMSYIRELRPYMYWLGFLKDAREAGELDWSAIGGTWGVATSRLLEWHPDADAFVPKYLPSLLDRVAHADNKNGRLLASYIGKYFEDMWAHLTALSKVVRQGGHIHYIVGNSTFYGVLIPVERIYRDMMLEAGFSKVEIATLRKRNSKKELVEFDVSATR